MHREPLSFCHRCHKLHPTYHNPAQHAQARHDDGLNVIGWLLLAATGCYYCTAAGYSYWLLATAAGHWTLYNSNRPYTYTYAYLSLPILRGVGRALAGQDGSQLRVIAHVLPSDPAGGAGLTGRGGVMARQCPSARILWRRERFYCMTIVPGIALPKPHHKRASISTENIS